MTIDVEVRFSNEIAAKLGMRYDITTYDEDYCEDIEGVIEWVNEELSNKYDLPLYYERGDYDIENLEAIEDELAYRQQEYGDQ